MLTYTYIFAGHLVDIHGMSMLNANVIVSSPSEFINAIWWPFAMYDFKSTILNIIIYLPGLAKVD